MFNNALPGEREKLQQAIKDDLNAVSAARRPARRSVRLSPSMLGEDCTAATWFRWRWVMKPQPTLDGRMARYNAKGEDEEAVVVSLLRDAGWTVEDVDTDGQQFAITDLQGHLYGKMDGRASHPVYTNGVKVLFENKYINTKRFVHLNSKPLVITDPKYYAQICIYMMLADLPACLFMTGNRNDADLAPVFVMRDDEYARGELRKAEAVAMAQSRPARIAETSAFYKCKTCEFVAVCHSNAPVDINCRACSFAVPIDGGKWRCNKWNATIPSRDAMEKACSDFSPIC